MPEISVIVPTYNRSSVLCRCLDSVFNQSFSDFEVIVVDDNSADDTSEIVSQYDDERLRYIRHEENRGGGAARNTGIEAAQGNYIAFLDSDDEWLSEKLEEQISTFKSSPRDIGVVYTGYYVSDSGSRRIGRLPESRGDIYRRQLMDDQVNPTSTVMVKSNCFDEVGTFDPELPARQDYDMWLRLSEYYEFEYVRDPLVVIHKNRDDRISSNYEPRMRANQIMLNRVRSRISDRSLVEKKSIIAKQYESIAGYAYISENYKDSQKYLIKSITAYPFGMRRWLLAFPSFLFISPSTMIHVKKLVNFVKSLGGRI